MRVPLLLGRHFPYKFAVNETLQGPGHVLPNH